MSGLVLAVAAGIFSPPLHASGYADLAVQTWSVDQGLPNSTVSAVVQHQDGYLWIGTFNGLARFDGVRFVTFNPGNTPALKHARVQRLYVDPRGTLWINTYDGALISFRDGNFTREWEGDVTRADKISLIPTRSREIIFALESGELIRRSLDAKAAGPWRVLRPPVELRDNATYLEDHEGVLWCLTRDKRIWKIAGDDYELVASGQTLGATLMRLVTDHTGRVWVATDTNAFRWDGAGFEAMAPASPEEKLALRFLFFPRDGQPWLIGNGRFRQMANRQWIDEVSEWRDLLGPDFPIYQQMHEDRQGGLWFAPPHRGIFYLAPDGQRRQLTTKDGLSSDFVTSWLEDREGNIWLGTERGGLVRLRQKRFHTLNLGQALSTAAAMSVCEDRHGTIWVGTFGNGLLRSQHGRTEQLLASKEPSGRFVLSVFPDVTGRIWASAGQEDLHVVADGALQRAPGTAHGIKALFVDRRERLWIGTKQELLCAIDGELRTPDVFKDASRQEVRAITEDHLGNIWIGTGSGVLYRYDDRACVPFKPDDVPMSYPIWSLCPDDDGTLWVGTFGGGLLRLKDGRFFRYTKQSGLPDDVICQILDDGSGHLWIGSHQGVFRMNKGALHAFSEGKLATVPSLVFGRHDGLPSLECTGGYQPSAWRSRDGTLWFATTGGVAYVEPSKLAANPAPPAVTIESVIVDGQPPALASTRERPAADGAPPGVREIPAGGKHLEFQYTALCFASPDQVRFRYKLEGLDEAWHEVGPRRFAQYSYLRPGNYRFLVSACNSDGIWNETGAALSIRVLPRFWQKWWVIGLFGATVIGAMIATVHRLSTNRLRRKLQGLERQRAIEEDRARIARDIHDDLGAGLTQITLFSELLRRDPPELAPEHVRQISETANFLTRSMDEIVWALNPKNDTLESLISYICSFAQEYLRSAGVKCRLEIPAHVPTAPVSSEMRHNLFLSIKEVLNNIVKHAGASEVWLRLSLARDRFRFTLEDDGRGMPASEAGDANGARLSAGHGLNNLKTRMEALGGTATVSAGTEGRGTRIALHVPFAIARSPRD